MGTKLVLPSELSSRGLLTAPALAIVALLSQGCATPDNTPGSYLCGPCQTATPETPCAQPSPSLTYHVCSRTPLSFVSPFPDVATSCVGSSPGFRELEGRRRIFSGSGTPTCSVARSPLGQAFSPQADRDVVCEPILDRQGRPTREPEVCPGSIRDGRAAAALLDLQNPSSLPCLGLAPGNCTALGPNSVVNPALFQDLTSMDESLVENRPNNVSVQTHGPVIKYDVVQWRVASSGGSPTGVSLMLSHGISLKYFRCSQNWPEEWRKELWAPHHALCMPGQIKARCYRRSQNQQNAGGGGSASGIQSSPMACPPGAQTVAETMSSVTPSLPVSVGSMLSMANVLSESAGKRFEQMRNSQRTANTSAAVAGGGKSGSAFDGGPSGAGQGSGSSSGFPGGGSPKQALASSSSGQNGAFTSLGSDAGAGTQEDDSKNQNATGNAEVSAGAESTEYVENRGGSRGGKKGEGDGGFASALTGLLGGQKGAGGTAGGAGGATGVTLGGTPSSAENSQQLSEAQWEALLKSQSQFSLFEIANRRYFQWNQTVIRAEAKSPSQP